MSFARLAIAVALVAIIGLVVLLVRYESAREAWRARAEIGSDGYDASASDAAYREVETALVWVERASRLAAVVIVATGIAIGRVRRRPVQRAHGWRRAITRAVDVTTLACVLATARVSSASPALTFALAWCVPAFLLAIVLGFAASGATIGERALRLG